MVFRLGRWALFHGTDGRPRARVKRVHQRLVIGTIALVAIGHASVAFAQTTLVRGTVRAAVEAGDRLSSWFVEHVVTIERVDTGQQWHATTSSSGTFEFQTLPPARYRLFAPGIDGRIVWSGERLALRGYRSEDFVLQEGRPLTFDIELLWVHADDPLARMPLTGRAVALPLADTCQTGRLPGVSPGREVWGAARLPDGQPAAGLPVLIERLSDGGPLTADHTDVRTRTSPAGCFGLAGLWPGRYRVYVDHAPYAFQAEVDLRETPVVQQDITLSAPPEDSRVRRLRSAWYPRLGIQAETFAALLDTVTRAEPALRRAVHDGTISPDDVVRVGGAVIWRYDPIEWRGHYRVPDARVVFEDEGSGQRWETTTAADGSYELYMPQGRYRVRVDHATPQGVAAGYPPFMPVSARILALPEGLVVREGFKTPKGSGLYPPRVARQTGLMAALNIGLVLPVGERTHVQTLTQDTHTVLSAPGSSNGPPSGAPLAIRFDQAALNRPLTSGRTVQALLGAVPGVVITESVGTLAQFSAIGQRRFANRLTVDGVSADLAVNMKTPALDEATSGTLPAQATSGGTQTLVPFSAVEEITVRTVDASPEFAQAPGAHTAIVTRAGGDRHSGLALFEGRPRALAAADAFPTLSGQPRRFSARNGAAALGGAAWRGRLFYFGVVERQDIDRPYAATVSVPSASLRESVSPTIQSILSAFPIPNGRDLGDGLAEYSHAFPISSSLSVISVRTDANVGIRHRLFARVNVGTSRGDAVSPPDQRPNFSFQHIESTRTSTATFGLMSAFAATAANDLRVNVSAHRGSLTAGTAAHGGSMALDLSVVAPAATAPWIRLTTPTASGALFFGPTQDASQRQVQVTDTFTAVRGQHELRMGIDVTHVAASTHAVTRYTYTFANIAQLREGRPRLIFEERPEARAIFRSFAAFTQDTWRPTPRLTLQFGVRYSVTPAPTSGTELTPAVVLFDSLPGVVTPRPAGGRLWRTSWRDVGPHVSAIYQLDTRERTQTTLRAGWDLVFDEVSSPGASAFGDGPPYISRRVIPQAVLPVSLDTLRNAPVFAAVEQYAFGENLKRPRTYRWHMGFDRELGRANRMELAYVGSAARQLVYHAAYQPPTVSAPIHIFSNEASADYHGMLAQYTRRIARGFGGRVFYTWSHAIDTDSGEAQLANLPSVISPVERNRASADYDRRHVLRVSGSYEPSAPAWLPLPLSWVNGWRFDFVGTAISGAPVTVLQRAGGNSPYYVRPDAIDGVPDWVDDASSPTRRRINRDAFSAPSTLGHGTLGRNTYRGSSLRQIDVGVSRSFGLSRATAHISIEAFNLFNLTNYGPPDGRLYDQDFGVPTASAADAFGSGSLVRGGLVALQQLGGPRSLKLGVRLTW